MFAVSSIKLLMQEGHEVHLACIKNSPIDIQSAKSGIQRFTFNSARPGLVNIIKLSQHMLYNSYQLIHTHYSKDLWIIIPALKFLGYTTPVVMTKHLGSAISKKDFLHKMLYRRLDHVVAISEVIRKNILDTTPVNETKVTLVHNYFDDKKFIKDDSTILGLKKEFGLNDSTLVLGMIGRITPGKGHEDVIEALRILRSDDLDVKVIVAGSAQKDEAGFEEYLKGLITKYSLEKYFVFTGFRNDVPALLSIFDIFLFPSHAEAFGLALIEAMAMGIPSIVCYSDGVKDIAVENETSLTFSRNDYASLAGKIEILMKDKQLRKHLSEKSFERSLLFTPDLFQKKIGRLYEKLLQEREHDCTDEIYNRGKIA